MLKFQTLYLIMKQMKQKKIKKKQLKSKKVKEYSSKEFVIEEIESYENEEDEKIVKRKKIEVKPMSEEEALLQMELLGHQFYIFKDAETSKVSVVYKRKEGNYGIIESE